MLIPIRCFTCGKVLADKYDVYVERVQKLEKEVLEKERKGERHESHHDHTAFDRISKKALLDEMGLTRYCCRRHMLSQVDMMEVI